jgi:hypothetical protein
MYPCKLGKTNKLLKTTFLSKDDVGFKPKNYDINTVGQWPLVQLKYIFLPQRFDLFPARLSSRPVNHD